MYLPNMFEHIALKFVRLLLFFFLCFFSILLKIALLMWEHELLFLNPPSSPSSDPKKEIVGGHCFLSTELTFLTSEIFSEEGKRLFSHFLKGPGDAFSKFTTSVPEECT